MKTKEAFPFLVWATTLIIAPLIRTFIESVYKGSKITKMDFQYMDIWWMLSFIYSLPVLIVYCIIFYALRKKDLSPTAIKLILISICIIGIIVTFAFLELHGWQLILSYSISVITSSLIYKIQRKEVKISN